MLNNVPIIKTSYTQLELCSALIAAWQELFNTTPSKEAIGIIVAQNGIETGASKFCYCYNIGNVKARDIPGQIINYCSLNGVWEIIGGKRIIIPPTNPGAWFLAFDTLKDGCKFHLNFLKTTSYKAAWPYIEQGSVAGYAAALRNHGYYTAPLANYIAGMNRFYNPYMKSTDYEHALASVDPTVVPPLQPWVSLPPDPLPEGAITIVPVVPGPIQQGIDDGEQVPQDQIEQVGAGIISKLMNFLGMIFQWLKIK